MFYNPEDTDKFQNELCLKLWRLRCGATFQSGVCIVLSGNCKQVNNILSYVLWIQKREWFFVCCSFFQGSIKMHCCGRKTNDKKPNLSRPASGGLMFSPDFLKNVSMLNINSCELLSHILLFPTFLPELKRLYRILWGYFHHFSVQCSELLNNWGLGCNASYCFHSLNFPLTKQLW